MNQDWDIKPRSQICQKCERHFGDQEPYYTRLNFTMAGYERFDCCESCWQGDRERGARHSSWRGIFKVPPQTPDASVKKETAESLLRALVGRDDPSQQNLAYILAVMLERQRVLAEKEVTLREDGTRLLIYEHKKTGETLVIADPRLRLDQLETVQREVTALLAGAGAADRPEAGVPAEAVAASSAPA